MALWRLLPTAQEDAAHWQRRLIWREVLVRAKTAAEARLVASELDAARGAVRNGNESLSFRSGFLDEKLYRVDRIGDEEGASEVLRASEGAITSN